MSGVRKDAYLLGETVSVNARHALMFSGRTYDRSVANLSDLSFACCAMYKYVHLLLKVASISVQSCGIYNKVSEYSEYEPNPKRTVYHLSSRLFHSLEHIVAMRLRECRKRKKMK